MSQRRIEMNFPSNVLAKIFERSTGMDVFRCARVCRQWREVANSPAIPWKRFFHEEFGEPLDDFDDSRDAYTQESRWKVGKLEQLSIEEEIENNFAMSNINRNSLIACADGPNLRMRQLPSAAVLWSRTFDEMDMLHINWERLHMSETYLAWGLGFRDDGLVTIVDVRSGNYVRSLGGLEFGRILCLHVHGDVLVSCSGDNTAKVWDITSGDCVRIIEANTRFPVTAAATDDKRIVMGTIDTIKIWDRENWECVLSIPLQYKPQSLELRGNLLCVLGRNIKIWDVRYGECVQEIGDYNFNPNGKGFCAFDGVKVIYRQPPQLKQLRHNRFRCDWVDSNLDMQYINEEQTARTLELPKHDRIYGVVLSRENIVVALGDPGIGRLALEVLSRVKPI